MAPHPFIRLFAIGISVPYDAGAFQCAVSLSRPLTTAWGIPGRTIRFILGRVRVRADAHMSLFLGTIACLPMQTSHMVRLLLADNHEVVRAGLRSLLEGRPSWSVVADASDGKQAILKAVSENP